MMNEQIFINISERYGDEVEVTIEDYQDLNPEATFEIIGSEIREYDADGNFVEVVAVVAEAS